MTILHPVPDKRSPNSKAISPVLLKLNSEISTSGMTLEFHSDFDLFREVVATIPERGAITSVFDPDKSNISSSNGFWVKGSNADGQVVHVQALRVDHLIDRGIASLWSENPAWYAPPGVDVDLDKTNFNTALASHKMSGTVCYHGDFWIHRSYRKFKLAPKLSTFAMLLALVKFHPDYIYCFIVPKHVRQGLAAQYGYLHIHPWAPQWHIRENNDVYDDYLVWVTGKELTELWTSSKRDAHVLGQVRQDGDRLPAVMESMASH